MGYLPCLLSEPSSSCINLPRVSQWKVLRHFLKNRKHAWESKGQVEEAGAEAKNPKPLPHTPDKTGRLGKVHRPIKVELLLGGKASSHIRTQRSHKQDHQLLKFMNKLMHANMKVRLQESKGASAIRVCYGFTQGIPETLMGKGASSKTIDSYWELKDCSTGFVEDSLITRI